MTNDPTFSTTTKIPFAYDSSGRQTLMSLSLCKRQSMLWTFRMNFIERAHAHTHTHTHTWRSFVSHVRLSNGTSRPIQSIEPDFRVNAHSTLKNRVSARNFQSTRKSAAIQIVRYVCVWLLKVLHSEMTHSINNFLMLRCQFYKFRFCNLPCTFGCSKLHGCVTFLKLCGCNMLPLDYIR